MVCEICKDTKVVFKNGNWVECQCIIQERLKYLYRALLPAPKSTAIVKELLSRADSLKKIILPVMRNNLHRTFLVSFLNKKIGMSAEFRIVNPYYLVDSYLGNIEERMYDIKGKVLICIYEFEEVPNKRKPAIISQFFDYHKDSIAVYYSYNRDSETKAVIRALRLQGFKEL